jgi:hypothetical protein
MIVNLLEINLNYNLCVGFLKKKELFFIETFLWGRNDVPLAAQGPFVLLLVN